MRESILVRQLLEEPLVVCIPGDWSLASKAEIHPRDLDGVPVIAVARDVLPAFHQEIEEYFHGFEVFVRIVADALSPLEALTYVEHKIGICIIAASAAASKRGIAVRPLATRGLVRRSGMFVREDNREPLIAEFVDLVLKRTAKIIRISS